MNGAMSSWFTSLGVASRSFPGGRFSVGPTNNLSSSGGEGRSKLKQPWWTAEDERGIRRLPTTQTLWGTFGRNRGRLAEAKQSARSKSERGSKYRSV